jgi:hypothetical protein
MAKTSTVAAVEPDQRPAADNVQDSAREAEDQAQFSANVHENARTLRGGFGTGAEFRQDTLYRRIVNAIFQDELGNLDLSETDQSIDAVFTTVADDMATRADEIGGEIAQQIANRLKAIGTTATRQVTLKKGVVAMDMAKAYVNWKPSQKLVNQTFFNAV